MSYTALHGEAWHSSISACFTNLFGRICELCEIEICEQPPTQDTPVSMALCARRREAKHKRQIIAFRAMYAEDDEDAITRLTVPEAMYLEVAVKLHDALHASANTTPAAPDASAGAAATTAPGTAADSASPSTAGRKRTRRTKVKTGQQEAEVAASSDTQPGPEEGPEVAAVSSTRAKMQALIKASAQKRSNGPVRKQQEEDPEPGSFWEEPK